MTRMKSGAVALLSAGLVLSCTSNPTGDLETGPARILVTPQFAVIDSGATTTAFVQVLDAQGNPLNGEISFTFPASVNVASDPSYRPNASQKYGRQYIVSALSADSNIIIFTASSGDADTLGFVAAPPASLLGATVTSLTPGVGALVTATVPAGGYEFTPASVVRVGAGSVPVQTVPLLANSTTIDFYVGPGANDTIRIDGVVSTFAPQLPAIEVKTAGVMTTPAIPDVSLSSSNPALGVPVTITAPAPYKFIPASTLFIPGAASAITGISADSSQLTFLPGPNANGQIIVDPMVVGTALGLGTFALASTQTLTTAALTNLNANYSTTTPNTNGLVTVSATGFLFQPGVTIDFNGVQQTVTAIAADSSSFTFRAGAAGASGTITVGGAALDFLPTVGLTLPTAAANEITVSATLNALAGTDAIATAPPVAVPPTGGSTVLNDVGTMADAAVAADCGNSPGGFNCRIYRLTTAADQTILVTANWSNTTDLGIYFADAAGNDIAPGFVCDAHGNGGTAHPESCTVDVPAGDNYMFVTTFGPLYPTNDPDPATINITVAGQ